MKRNFLLFLLSFIFMLHACQDKEEIIILEQDLVSQYELDKAIIQVNTTNVATGFETVFTSMITDSVERAHFSQAFVNPVRFFEDQSGYFFLESFDAWVIAHPTRPEIIGTWRWNAQDIHGKYFVRDIVNTVKYIGYGFVEYYYENYETGQTERKLTFAKALPSGEAFIAAGMYGDPPAYYYEPNEANTEIVIQTTNTFAEGIGGVFENYYTDSLTRVEFCRKMIDHVRFFDNQSGYFFMYDFDCVNVAHGTQKDLQGKDLYDYQDSRGNYVIRGLVEIAKNEGEGFYEYWWNNPVTGQEEPKIAWVKKVPGIDYFIGSGIYLQ
ncbi:MAG: cache domain-containing protein [Bacteroidales bacterium]|nr:cache domain-containing protein [Bacteroidales bacterium]MCF8399678.1 cache domain-containing protein [Bacteroidales bacterium]